MRTAQETSRRNSSTTGYRPDVVQRKCACGGSSSLETECEDCKRNKIDVQRYSVRREAPDTLISRFVIGSKIALPDSSDNPSALGHNFSQIRVHQNTKPKLQTKLRARVPSEPHEEEADRIANLVTQPLQAANAVRREPIESSQVQLAVQRAPDDRSEQSSEAGKEAMPQTATPTEKSPARSLIVEDGAGVLPGQMRKTEFLDQMEREVCAAADAELAAAGRTAQGCPYIRNWLGFYRTQNSQHVERALRRYAPEATNASGARDYIPIVAERVRRAARIWAETGQITGLPAELAGQLPGAGLLGAIGGILSGAAGILGGMFGGIGRAISGIFAKPREGGAREADDPQAIQAQLSSGHSLDAGVKSRMESAFGHDFSRVRIHNESRAADLSANLNARAFTIGSDVAFGAGEYQPGTPIGDALLAHELAHVVQQGGAGSSSGLMEKGGIDNNQLEQDADASAVGAVVSIWSGNNQHSSLSANTRTSLKSGLRLQRCSKSSGPKVETKSVCVQPIQIADDDGKNPTKLPSFASAQAVWKKCCIDVTVGAAKSVSGKAFKELDEAPGNTPTAEEQSLFSAAPGAGGCISVFVPETFKQDGKVSKDISGGGATYDAGQSNPKVLIVEGGTKVPHELGHAMGYSFALGINAHQPAGTVMEPVGGHDATQSEKVADEICQQVRKYANARSTSGPANCSMDT